MLKLYVAIALVILIVVIGGVVMWRNKERMVAASTVSGLSRGYNALATQGNYLPAMLTLSEAEKMNLNNVDPSA